MQARILKIKIKRLISAFGTCMCTLGATNPPEVFSGALTTQHLSRAFVRSYMRKEMFDVYENLYTASTLEHSDRHAKYSEFFVRGGCSRVLARSTTLSIRPWQCARTRVRASPAQKSLYIINAGWAQRLCAIRRGPFSVKAQRSAAKWSIAIMLNGGRKNAIALIYNVGSAL